MTKKFIYPSTIFILLSSFFVASINALSSDPNCLNVPTEAPVKAWKIEGLAELLGEKEVKEERVPINKASLFATGIIFSEIVYLAPDLETAETPKAFVEQYKNFLSKIPSGYQLYHLSSDPQSGLKYAIFRPSAGSEYSPWVLSVAGTQTLLDKIVDGLMGREQMERLSQLFTKCLFQNDAGVPTLDIPLVFVGHSLGGGLAQSLYHQIQGRLSALRAKGFISPLSLVTFNAFGGKALLEQIQVAFNPAYIEDHRVENYYVQGDIVSRVGRHIGPAYEMLPYRSQSGEVAKLPLGTAHALNTFKIITKESAALNLKMPYTPKAPDYLYSINKFYEAQKDKALGFALFLIPKVSYLIRSNSGDIASFLENTAGHISEFEIKSAPNLSMMSYVQMLGQDEESRLRARFSLTGKIHKRADELRQSLDASNEKLNSKQSVLLDYLRRNR